MFSANTKYYIFLLIIFLISCDFGVPNNKVEIKDKGSPHIYERVDASIVKKQNEKRREFWRKKHDSKRRNEIVRKKHSEFKNTSS